MMQKSGCGSATARTTRRKFLLYSLGAAGGLAIVSCEGGGPGIAGPIIDSFEELPTPKRVVARVEDLVEGMPIDFDYPDAGMLCFVVKLGTHAEKGTGSDSDIVGFSYVCTHMGCPVVGGYNHEHKVLGPCRCHYTTFSLRHRGMVVLGQATQNLVQLTLSLEEDEIVVSGFEGIRYGELAVRAQEDRPKEKSS